MPARMLIICVRLHPDTIDRLDHVAAKPLTFSRTIFPRAYHREISRSDVLRHVIQTGLDTLQDVEPIDLQEPAPC